MKEWAKILFLLVATYYPFVPTRYSAIDVKQRKARSYFIESIIAGLIIPLTFKRRES